MQYLPSDKVGKYIAPPKTTASSSLKQQNDSLDRITQRTLSGTGIAQPEVTSYRWDAGGHLLGHSTALGAQTHATSYEYDAAGRLAARKVQAGSQADLVTQRYGYGYDQAECLTQIRYLRVEGTVSEQLIEQIDYGYDAAGQRVSKTTLNGNGTGQGETPMSATYDSANRMSPPVSD